MKRSKKDVIISLAFTSIFSFLLIKALPNPVLFYVAAVFTIAGTVCAVKSREFAQLEVTEAERKYVSMLITVLGCFLTLGFLFFGIGQSFLGLYNLFLWLDPGAILSIFVYTDIIIGFMRSNHILLK